MSSGRTGTLDTHLVDAITHMLKTTELLLDLRHEDENAQAGLHRLIQSVVEGGHVDYGLLDACRDLIDEYQGLLEPHGSFEQVVILRDQLHVLYGRVDEISRERAAKARLHMQNLHHCTQSCFHLKA